MEDQAHPPRSQLESAPGPLEFWRILRRGKRPLTRFACAGCLIGYLITLSQLPIYQARTSIEIVNVNDNFLNTKQVKPVTETGSTSEMADLQTQIRILLSESLLGRVLDKLRRESTVGFARQSLLPAWRRAFHLERSSPAGWRSEAW